ncbi:MAG: hypothetical protein WC843_04905 [Candidatus Gracilibacteria bacterium]
MPISSLYAAYVQMLQNSTCYKLLGNAEQQELLTAFNLASDEQINAAMEEIKKSEIVFAEAEAKRKQHDERQIQLVSEIKITLREIDKTELKENEQKDAANSIQISEQLLASLNQVPTTNKPERKKFFGLF